MLLAFAATGLVGLLLGCWFRAPALLAGSAVTAVVCLSVASFTKLELASTVGLTLALVSVLQVGYLAGPDAVLCLVAVSFLASSGPGVHPRPR